MSRIKRDMGMMLTGLALGAVLTGGAVAAGVMAEPSWQNIYVDGRQVHMTAYNIGGNDFVKLRDIGKEVGFNVYWRYGVQVDSDAPYTGSAPAQAVQTAQTSPAEDVRVSCYKEGPMAVGDGTGLMIYPGGVEYTVNSSDPSIVSVEKALGQFWKANAISPGTATITATGPDGKSELPIDESLMNAAQDVSSQCIGKHRPYDHQALIRYGWPHGGMYNLIVIDVNSFPDIAQKAVTAWTLSPGRFQTMVMDEGSCLGSGVTIKDGTAYCFMVVGDPTGHNPYE